MEITVLEIIIFISLALVVPFAFSFITNIQNANTHAATLTKLNLKSLLPLIPLALGIGMYILLKYLNINYFLQEHYIVIIAAILFTIIFYSLYFIGFYLEKIDDHLAIYTVSNILHILSTGGLIAIFSIITKTYNNSFLIFYAVLFGLNLLFGIANIILIEDGVEASITFTTFNGIIAAGLMIAYGVLIITVFTSVWAFCFIPFGIILILGVSAIVAVMES